MPVALTEGFPAGGYHIANGVSNDLFDPSAVDIGETQIGYVYEHICGVDTAFDTVTVLAYPELDVDRDFEVCLNANTELITNGDYAETVWNDTTLSDIYEVKGADFGVGSFDQKIRVMNEIGCYDSGRVTWTVLDTQSIEIPDTSVCLDQELWLYGPDSAGLLYNWSSGEVSQDIIAYDGSLSRPDRKTIGLRIENNAGCTSIDSIRVDIIDCDTVRPDGFFSIYPNPATDLFTLEVFAAADQEILALVYDVSGKMLEWRKVTLTKGKNWIDYSTEAFGAGVVIVQFRLDDTVISTRVVIL